MVDRSSPLPLWAQIEADLRSRLSRGDFDDAFPTEPELMGSYEVSRPTVRQAIAALERDGLVVRRRGDGTRAADRRLSDPHTALYSLAGWIESTGVDERSRVSECAVVPVPTAPAVALGLRPGESVVHVARVRYGGDEPLAIVRSWIPGAVGGGLLDADLSSGSLYEHLHRTASVRPTGSEERILPVDPDPADRALLHLPGPELAFRINRLVYAGSSAIEYREAVIRGDRYRLSATWGSVPAGAPSPD